MDLLLICYSSTVRMFRVILLSAVLGLGYGIPTPARSEYDTIVIGLGAAGTAAASTLAAAGKKVLALEAQDRFGGRVNTQPFGDGIIETGAEWIHGTESSSTYELAIKNNVSILLQSPSIKVYISDGSSDNEALINELTEFALAVVQEPPENPEPLGQYVTKRVLDYIKANHTSVQNDTDLINGFLEFMNQVVNTYESSNNWNDITTHSPYEELGGEQSMSWHTNGYKTLFEILLNTYNNGPGYPSLEIKLNTEVTNIQYPQNPNEPVVVTTKDGATYTAKTAIVTVSVGVLQERYETLFSPPLPEQKIHSINAISLGLCDKIIFRFPTNWWLPNHECSFVWRAGDKAGVSEADKWMTKINGIGIPMASNTSIVLWVCGDDAKKVESLPNDVVKSKSMEVIRRFMGVGKTIPEPTEMLKSNWYSNPFTRGSYSYDNVQTPQNPTARVDLALPITDSSGSPRLLFAGEATNRNHFSTVHGAVDSGRREARRILETSKIESN